jgi:hypothetical protein
MSLKSNRSLTLDALDTPDGQKVAQRFREEWANTNDFGRAWKAAADKAEELGVSNAFLVAIFVDLLNFGSPLIAPILRELLKEKKKPKSK